MKIKHFFKTFLKSLNPNVYSSLSQESLKSGFSYFVFLLLGVYLILLLLSIPSLMGMKNTLNSKLSKISLFDVSVNVSAEIPILFPSNNPFIEVDFSSINSSNKSISSLIYINKTNLLLNSFFIKKNIKWKDYKHMSSNKKPLVNVLSLLFYLLIPSLIIIYLLFIFAKILILILLFSILIFIIMKALKFEVSLPMIFKVGIFSSTIFIIKLIFSRFSVLYFNSYFIEYVLFFVLFILGVIKVSRFGVPRKNRGNKSIQKKKTNIHKDEFVNIDEIK